MFWAISVELDLHFSPYDNYNMTADCYYKFLVFAFVSHYAPWRHIGLPYLAIQNCCFIWHPWELRPFVSIVCKAIMLKIFFICSYVLLPPCLSNLIFFLRSLANLRFFFENISRKRAPTRNILILMIMTIRTRMESPMREEINWGVVTQKMNRLPNQGLKDQKGWWRALLMTRN